MSEAEAGRSGGAPIARADTLLREETRGRRAKHRRQERCGRGARKILRSKKSNSRESPAGWSGQIRWTCRLFSRRGREECRPERGQCRRLATRVGGDIRSGASGGGVGGPVLGSETGAPTFYPPEKWWDVVVRCV